MIPKLCSIIKFIDAEATKEITDVTTLIIDVSGHTWNKSYTVDKEATASV